MSVANLHYVVRAAAAGLCSRLKMYWSAILVLTCVLAFYAQGHTIDAIALLCGAAGLGQALYLTNRSRAAAETAQLTAIAAEDKAGLALHATNQARAAAESAQLTALAAEAAAGKALCSTNTACIAAEMAQLAAFAAEAKASQALSSTNRTCAAAELAQIVAAVAEAKARQVVNEVKRTITEIAGPTVENHVAADADLIDRRDAP
ncbi:hypothetical protein [Paludisphaera mucosa]|uniref:Uncharacterized protein n=1 Tax=Paludisphaera mucosa TaxID=3030827 RepID=A0ABT6FA60_9BACT|nr:hypothetical protein [Paludisphaera mucosa]MDG3004470.1 hypothetical protein [Paludisphaera mucosa]